MFEPKARKLDLDSAISRIESLAAKVEENHNQVADLQRRVSELEKENDGYMQDIAALEARQSVLRQGIVSLLEGDPGVSKGIDIQLADSGQRMQVITDHICGSSQHPPQFCQYCFEQKRYYGSRCGCSPEGYPHSEDCKGFNATYQRMSSEEMVRQQNAKK